MVYGKVLKSNVFKRQKLYKVRNCRVVNHINIKYVVPMVNLKCYNV